MKVRDVMVETPAYCASDMNLGTAVAILWTFNCGFLPVVDSQMKVTGVITDRDICVALGTRNCLPGEITVGEVNSGKVYACKPNDDIRAALATMSAQKVRRLPVVDADGKLLAILSLDDIILHVQVRDTSRPLDISSEDVMNTLKYVCAPYLPAVVRGKTAAA
jgi:CBS domain-containing protein